MGDMYGLLFTLVPTLLFVLIVVVAIVLGIIRGFRKSLILAIQALVAFITCIIIFAIFANNSQVDSNLVSITNNFMGQGGLQRAMGVSENSEKLTEILYEFIPKQMDYGSGIELILRENGQYLLQLVLFVYRLVLAIICLILYFLLVFILYIVYLIFYPERRYKRKIEDKNASLDTENQYKKRRLYGSLIGLVRGLVGGIVIMAFIGSFFYIAGGTGNNKYDKEVSFEDQGMNEGYQLYQALGSYGSSGIFKILNTIQVKDNMPFYLYAADLVFSGKIEDPNRGINVKFNFADEMGAYTTFTRKTIDLLMKYGKNDLINVVNSKGEIMPVILQIMSQKEFQQEFDQLIDDFNAKTYFVNFTLSLLDSIILHLDELKLSETSPEAIETISLVFKKGYLTEYIPEEEEELNKLKADPNYKYEIQPFITASSLLTKDDAKSLLKFVVGAIELDEAEDDTQRIMAFAEKLLPSLKQLSIFSKDSNRKNELNPVYERLYVYLDNRYIQTSLQQNTTKNKSLVKDSKAALLKGLDTESMDWCTELSQLLDASANVLGIAKSVYDPNNEVFDNVLNMFASTNAKAAINEEKYDGIVESLKYSALLNRVMSSEGMAAFIKNALQSSMPNVYVPAVTYMNTYDARGNEVNGEAYNLLVGFKSLLKNEKTRLALKDYKLLQDDNQGVKFVKELLTAMNEKDAAGNTPLKTSMNSILLRSIFTGAVTSANIGIELIIPNSILEEENGQIVNIIQKDELVNVIENLLVIMPEGDEINKSELINAIFKNQEQLLKSDTITATAINFIVNDKSTGLSDVLVIPDNYKADSTKEKLAEYDDTNIWKTSGELSKILDGLDKGFELSSSNIDLDNQEETTNTIKNNIKKLNDKLDDNTTKLDKCYESIIIRASLTKVMTGDDVKGLAIPDDAYSTNKDDKYVVDGNEKHCIAKQEISSLIVVANKLELDLSSANVETIKLKKADVPDLAASKIFRATINGVLADNNDIVLPKDEVETMHKTINDCYISERELTNLLDILTTYRENILGNADENAPINIKNIQVNDEKIKEFKVSELKELTKSNILEATVINKLATSSDYPINVPSKLKNEADKAYLETNDNFIKSDWVALNELNKILTSFDDIFEEGTTIGEINEDLIKSKVLQDGAVEACYTSLVLNYTISEKLAEQLDKPDMSRAPVSEYAKVKLNEAYATELSSANITSGYDEVTYKKVEVVNLVAAVKAIGVTDIAKIESEVNVDTILDLEDSAVDTLHNSIIVWDILTVKVESELTKPDSKMVDHPLAKEAYVSSIALDFYKEDEVLSIKSIVKDIKNKEENQNKTIEEIFKDFDASDIDINENTKNSILGSYILMANVTHSISTNNDITDPKDAYNQEYPKGSEYELLNENDISDLIDVAIKLDIKLGKFDSINLNKNDNPTISKSIIMRATLYTKIKENPDVVVPDCGLDNNEEDNTYLTTTESTNLLNSLCDNKKELFSVENDTDPIDISNIVIDETKIKSIKIKNLDGAMLSDILHATVINKLANGGYGVDVPETYKNETLSDEFITDFKNTEWVKLEEMDHIIYALKDMFGAESTFNIDSDSVKQKILSDDFHVNVCYGSIVVNYTVSNNLAKELEKEDMNRAEVTAYTKVKLSEAYNLTSGFDELSYAQEEVELLLKAIKSLGVEDVNDLQTYDYTSKLLESGTDYEPLHNSILVWDILTVKMQKELDGNANVKDHPLAREEYTNDLALTFYRKEELESIRTVIKSKSEDTNLDTFSASDIAINDTTKAAINSSYILMATITDKVYTNTDLTDPLDSYDATYDRTSENRLLTVESIDDLLNVVTALELDLGNISISSIKLKKDNNGTLSTSMIFRATMYNKIYGNESIVIPNSSLEKNETNNTYLFKNEAKKFLDAVCDNKSTFYGEGDSVDIANPNMTDANIKKLKISSLDGMIESDILHATIINKLSNGSYGVEVPTTYKNEVSSTVFITNFHSTNWVNNDEMHNLIAALKLLFGTDSTLDIDPEDAKETILNLTDAQLDTCYESIVANYTVSNQIYNSLEAKNRVEVTNYSMEELHVYYGIAEGFNDKAYKLSEVKLMLKAVNALGITDLGNVESQVNANTVMGLDDNNIHTLYNSILVWDILSDKMDTEIANNADVKDHIAAHEERQSLGITFIKEIEVTSIKAVIGNKTISTFTASDIDIKDNGTRIAITESYILKASITNKVENSDATAPTDAYNPNYSGTNSVLTNVAILDLLDVVDALDLDLGNINVSSIKLEKANNDTLSKSIIFRATIYTKIKDNESVVIPKSTLEKNETNNTYLFKDEAKKFLDAVCDNKSTFYGEGDSVDIANPNMTDASIKTLKISSLDDMITSDILHATIINKISNGSFGLEIPTTYYDESQKDSLMANFNDTYWVNNHEMHYLIAALKLLFGADSTLDVDPSSAKAKLFDTAFDIDTCYESIIANYTISNQIDDALPDLRNKVVVYSQDTLKNTYALASGFAENAYKVEEVEKMIAAVKALGISDLSNMDAVKYNEIIIKVTEDKYDIIYQSAIVTDVIYKELTTIISENTTIKDHAKSKTELFGIDGINFYKEAELVAMSKLLDDSGATDAKTFDTNNLTISGDMAATINKSYILRNTVSTIIVGTDIVIDKASYDASDALITTTALYDLFNSIEVGIGNVNVGSLNADSIKPAEIKSHDILNSTIIRATISDNITTDSGKLYVSRELAYLSNNYDETSEILIINKSELSALIDAIANQDNFDVELTLDMILNTIDIEKLETILESSILRILITDLISAAYDSGMPPVLTPTYTINESKSKYYGEVITLVSNGYTYKFPATTNIDTYVVNNTGNTVELSNNADNSAINIVGYILNARSSM